MGLVVVCVGSGREFEARWEMVSWFGGKKGAPRRQVVRGTEGERAEFSYHAATPEREGGERSWIWAAVSLSMTTMRPPHLGQSQSGHGSWAGEASGSVCDGGAALSA